MCKPWERYQLVFPFLQEKWIIAIQRVVWKANLQNRLRPKIQLQQLRRVCLRWICFPNSLNSYFRSVLYVHYGIEITVMHREEGLNQIISNLGISAVTSSVGILERAMKQVDDYDYLVRNEVKVHE